MLECVRECWWSACLPKSLVAVSSAEGLSDNSRQLSLLSSALPLACPLPVFTRGRWACLHLNSLQGFVDILPAPRLSCLCCWLPCFLVSPPHSLLFTHQSLLLPVGPVHRCCFPHFSYLTVGKTVAANHGPLTPPSAVSRASRPGCSLEFLLGCVCLSGAEATQASGVPTLCLTLPVGCQFSSS